jgi:outer membrane lipopolysaccharide assembly protein LptE/RlpB
LTHQPSGELATSKGTVGQVPAEQVEKVIRQLRDVLSARVVVDKHGAIQEIHVLVSSNRSPKQVVRDIESALLASHGIVVDHRKISVAQMQGALLRSLRNRLRVADVEITVNGTKAEASVHLQRGSETFTGQAAGQGSQSNQLRLIATATVRAVEQACQMSDQIAVEDINPNVVVAGRQVVVVVVNMLSQYGEDVLAGSALVRHDLNRAVVNAVLDALNRRTAALQDE